MNKAVSSLWLAVAVLFSLGGFAAFIRLFLREMNVYWFILSPIILAVYQFPAVVVYALWKKKKAASTPPPEPPNPS